MQPLGRVQSLAVELEDGQVWGAYSSGELQHGRVQLELRSPLQLRALEVYARGCAAVHWLESFSVGLSILYRDYTANRPSCTAAASSSLVRLGYGGALLLQDVGLGPPWAADIPLWVNLCPGAYQPKQGGPSWTPFSHLLRGFLCYWFLGGCLRAQGW